jgi:hypothetical protein
MGSENVTCLRAMNCVIVRGTYDFDKTDFFIGIENRQWGGGPFLRVQICKNMLLPVKQTFTE